MINTDEYLKKVNDLLGDEHDLILVKGELNKIDKCFKEDGSVYYMGDLRVLRNTNTGSEYDIKTSNYLCCFGSEFVLDAKLDDDKMKALKNNEVLLILNCLSNIKTIKSKKDGVEDSFKVDNVRFFVQDVLLTKKLEKVSQTKRTIKVAI